MKEESTTAASHTRRSRLPALGLLVVALTVLGGVAKSPAGILTIRPIDFGSGVTATGTITVQDGTATILDWNLTVTTREQLAHFTSANVPIKDVSMVNVSADGSRMTVVPNDSSAGEGGMLAFRSPNPQAESAVSIADFTGVNADTGQAYYIAGAAFDFLSPLTAPGQPEYLAATAAAGSKLFDLVPLQFSGGVTMTGHILTDGATGALTAANLKSWDISVDQVTEDVFTSSNSTLTSLGLALDSNGDLTVDNPDGLLSFSKGLLGGRQHALTLANFIQGDPFEGTADYFLGRQALYQVFLNARRGPWRVTGAGVVSAVPEPSSIRLAIMGVLVVPIVVQRGLRRRAGWAS